VPGMIDLLPGLPPIDGWTITGELSDIDGLDQAFIEYMEIGERPGLAWEAIEQPAKDIAEYKYRLSRARRKAARARLQDLIVVFDSILPKLLEGVDRDSQTVFEGELASHRMEDPGRHPSPKGARVI